jgi:hypothetical protein
MIPKEAMPAFYNKHGTAGLDKYEDETQRQYLISQLHLINGHSPLERST